MSAVDTLRAKAARLADQLRDAETKAAAEAVAVRERNAERRREFWADAGERVAAAATASREARQEVLDRLAAGEAARALDSYLEYRLRHAEHRWLTEAAKSATAYYVDDAGQRVEVPEDGVVPLNARNRAYPAGLGYSVGTADTWEKLLSEGADAMAEQHRRTFAAGYTRELRDSLEPEGGDQ